jgi:hypothetical protein
LPWDYWLAARAAVIVLRSLLGGKLLLFAAMILQGGRDHAFGRFMNQNLAQSGSATRTSAP